MYSHHDHDIDVDMDEEFWPMMGILFTIWGGWTGVVHFLDWLTVDAIVWWAEPLTILPFIFLLVMAGEVRFVESVALVAHVLGLQDQTARRREDNHISHQW